LILQFKMHKPKIIAIAAMDEKRVIGNNGGLCWHIPEDMKRFAELTKGNTVIMGRKTFDSLPDKFKPLPQRKNIVISKTLKSIPEKPDVAVFDSIENALLALQSGGTKTQGDIIWIIGGEQIYRSSLNHWDEIELTLVKGSHEGDVFFPDFEKDFKETERKEFQNYSFIHYSRS
jgi:dihydrofolate reductase